MIDNSDRPFRLVSFADDQAHEERGSLIPQSVRNAQAAKKSRFASAHSFVTTGFPIAVLAIFSFLAVSSYDLIRPGNQVASPSVTIIDPYTFNKVALSYGPQSALSQTNFFTETRDAFIDEAVTFVELDLSAMMLRSFEKGVLVQSTKILARGEEGSWWDAPSGLYKVEKLDERSFSTVAQSYFPWSVTFEGNYTIHGWPEYPDGTSAPESFSGGGIRIENGEAEKLFASLEKGVPVLVHQQPKEADAFVYEPTVPEVGAEHYLVADLENSSILAASDLDVMVPIASLTKLMTAVVASEKLNLDSRVQVTSPTFVSSLIPRLADRSSVSMYSLMQLLLIESSNESAEVIAGEFGRDAFIAEMNTKARQLGMMNSQFADPSGLSPDNKSSLGDLYRLSRYIHNNRNFIFEITAGKEASAISGSGEFEELVNFNEINDIDNFIGGKVGETNAAGQTSVSLHEVTIQGSKRTVVIILLGSTGRTEDVQTLMHFVEDRFSR